MATWKKIITSGSAAELSSLTLDTALPVAQGGIGATSLNNLITLGTHTTGNYVATITAGTGLTSTGATSGETIAHSLSVDAVQTQITDVGTLDEGAISSGFGNIDIGTSTLNAGNTTLDNFTNNSAVADSHFTGSFTGSFVGDGSNLTGVAQDIDTLSAGSDIVSTDKFLYSNNGTEESITFGIVSSSVFANISGEVTIAAGGAATVANNVIDESNLKTSVAGDGLSGGGGSALSVDLSGLSTVSIGAGTSETTVNDNLTVTGDLTVNGATTTVATTNTKVEDQLMFLGTGSAGSPGKDIGIVAQSGSTDLQGSAFYNDINSQRWSVQKSVNHNATSITPLQFVTTVKTDATNPNETSGSYGAGEMHVNTTTGEIWIRFG